MNINEQIFQFFYSFAHQSDFLDKIFVFLAVYFPWVAGALALIFLLYHYRVFSSPSPLGALIENWQVILFPIFTGVFAWVIAYLLKSMIHAARPMEILSYVSPLMVKDGYSFPSGHTTLFSALAFSIFFLNKKAGCVFILLTLLIGFSRIASGVHFPADILGGFLLGFAVSFLLNKFSKKI